MVKVSFQRLKDWVLLVDQYTDGVCVESYNYLAAILVRNLLIKKINNKKDPYLLDKTVTIICENLSHSLVGHGIYPKTQRWIWRTINRLVYRSSISIDSVTKIIDIVIRDLMNLNIYPFHLEKIVEIPCDDYILPIKNDDQTHVTVGVYPNGEYKINIVRGQDLEEHVEYNIKNRFGRALFVDGICRFSRYLSKDEILVWTKKIKGMKFDLSIPSSQYH